MPHDALQMPLFKRHAVSLQMSLFAPAWNLPDSINKNPVKYEDPFLAANKETLDTVGDARITFDKSAWNHDARGAVGADVEVFSNFFLICFKRFADGRRLAFERSVRSDLDVDLIVKILSNNTIITFNGNAYDVPMISLALSGADNREIMEVNREIIDGRPKQTERAQFDHIDLMGPNPSVRQGLKMLNGRLHGRFMVDTPYSPEAVLTPRQMNVVTLYCFNDLNATERLYGVLREPLKMRAAFGRRYGMDLRSKSDSQVGEAVVLRQVGRLTGSKGKPQDLTVHGFGYDPPSFLKFNDDRLANILRSLSETTFYVNAAGKVQAPDLLSNLTLRISAGEYRMGIGGLHSTEAHRTLRSDDERFLMDVDVASQYPNIIMKLGLYPPALGPAFLRVYGDLLKERLEAKAAGDRVKMDGGRVALNGVYGKLGSPYSALYAPHLTVAITLTGQLAILILIERAERAGVPVVSANTDGVIFHCPHSAESTLEEILAQWEMDTGFTIERTRYRALHSSSVNTYVAIKEDGKVKRKGWIANPWADGDLRGMMSKNPQMTVCSDAAVNYLKEGTPIRDTVLGCNDPRAFVTLIKVTNGGVWRGNPLGRAVRYYWSTDGDPITTADGTRRIPKTEGARPMQELMDGRPPDADLLRYCEEAHRLLVDLGA